MSISHQHYAELASEAYSNEYSPGPRTLGKGEQITLEGVTYELREYTTNPPGYQGMIFQRVDTGEIVVAHRGTEFTGDQAIEDAVRADGGFPNTNTDAGLDVPVLSSSCTIHRNGRLRPPAHRTACPVAIRYFPA